MIIVHRCVHCGHPDIYSLNSSRKGSIVHSGRSDGQEVKDFRLVRNRCHESCPKCTATCEWGPPELMVRFRAGAYAQRVPLLVEPGHLAFGATHGLAKMYACACDSCVVQYTELMPYDGTVQLLELAEPVSTSTTPTPVYAPRPDAPVVAPFDNGGYLGAGADVVNLDGQEELALFE